MVNDTPSPFWDILHVLFWNGVYRWEKVAVTNNFILRFRKNDWIFSRVKNGVNIMPRAFNSSFFQVIFGGYHFSLAYNTYKL